MGNCDELHTERVKCKKCGTINIVYVKTVFDEENDTDFSVEITEYTQCSNCKRQITDSDLSL